MTTTNDPEKSLPPDEQALISEIMFEKLCGPQKPPSWLWALLCLRLSTALHCFRQKRKWRANGRREREAIAAVNAWTRKKMREDGPIRRIMPLVPITNDELDRQEPCDEPSADDDDDEDDLPSWDYEPPFSSDEVKRGHPR